MKLRITSLLCFFLYILLMNPFCGVAKTIYVDKEATGLETGTSWYNALEHLQDGLDSAVAGDEIWVAKGRYLPTIEHGGSGDEYKSFQMKNGVRIYGGFDPAIGDTLFTDRDWNQNKTILSGDLGWQDYDSDNALHVFYHPDSLGLNTSAVLDGFTICHGFARASQADGGGMFNSEASPTIQNCTFNHNKAKNGAGMYNELYSEPVVTNTLFSYNRADFGGGIMNSSMMNTDKNSAFINCTFFGNMAGIEGGGMYNHVYPTRIANCIFRENTPESIAEFDGRQDVNVTFSNIQMPPKLVFPGLGNINTDPLFNNIPVFIDYTVAADNAKTLVVADASIYAVGDNIEVDNDGIIRSVNLIFGDEVIIKPSLPSDSEEGMQIKNWKNTMSQTEDFHLSPSSPCVDTGSNLIKGIPSEDFENEDRIIDGDGDSTKTADMGIDEFRPDTIIYVDYEAPGSNEGVSWNNAYNDLQDALDTAWPGDQIWVAAGTYTPSEMIDASDARTAAFQLKNGVTLYGGFDPSTGDTNFSNRNVTANMTVLSGEIGDPSDDNCYHVFYHPLSLGLDQTAILDGFYIQKGYASDGGHININQQGGGLYNNGCSPTIRNCHFRDNRAVYGGAMYNENASPNITDCTFSDNNGDYGGGMYNINASLSLSYCMFGSDSLVGNTAYLGGGMYAAAGSDITATDCMFRNNTGHNGGGIYCDNAAIVLTNSDILYNECDTSSTDHGNGAGIYMNNSFVTLNDLTVSHNYGYHKGGGIYCVQGTPVLHNVLITRNIALNGGGLYFDNCGGRIDGTSAIENNSLHGSGNGGGIYLSNGANTAFNGIIISSNTADENYSFGGGIYCDTASPVFLDCHINNNSGYSGGGIALFNESVPDFQGCIIDNNEAVIYGGGIYINGSNSLFSNCSISNNTTTNVSSSGGGIACLAGVPVLTDCVLDGNRSTSVGAGMLVENDSGIAAPVLTRCIFRNNIVSRDSSGYASGGGMYVSNNAAPVLSSCTFDSNQALGNYIDSGGGGLYNFFAIVTLIDCTFTDNFVNKFGGAIYSRSGMAKISHTSFTENQASINGGAYYGTSDNEGSFFNFCRFESNSASNGGGLYLFNSCNSIVNSIFQTNTAITGGGIMVNNESEPIHISGSLFTDNLATSGSAIFLDQANPYIENCTIVANRITDPPFARCGGIFNDDASPTISNSIIYGNASSEIYNQGTSNPIVTWSDIQGGYGTTSDNNLNTNPRLDPNFRLGYDSPLIDAGNNSLLPTDITDVDNDMDTTESLPLDIFQGQRLVDDPATLPNGVDRVDIGADEYEPGSGCIFDDNSDGDVDGKDLAVFIDGSIENIAGFADEFGNNECTDL